MLKLLLNLPTEIILIDTFVADKKYIEWKPYIL